MCGGFLELNGVCDEWCIWLLIVDYLGMDNKMTSIDFIVFIYSCSPSRRPGC